MKTLVRLAFIALMISFCASAQAQQKFDDFATRFIKGYKALDLPELPLSYVEGFKNIKSADGVQKQLNFFSGIERDLKQFDVNKLNANQKTDYRLIQYETKLNLSRVALEKQWLSSDHSALPENGIINVPHGKEWYAYLLKRWISDEVTPDQIYQFGLKEVEKVKQHIEEVRKRTGLSEDAFYKRLNDPSFFIKDQRAVQDSFEHVKTIIYANLYKQFNQTQFPDLKIEPGHDKALAQTPGFYTGNVFYYNLFDQPYNKRQVDWLFIHEGVPGHHYQISMNATAKGTGVQQLFSYLGFIEGWGAYAEYLGKDLGVYRSPYDEMGKWEWDIVRSVRVPLDIGLNYYGWTDAQALDFWKKNIKNQDDIAMREINRMRRWPAQVITYKYGASQILEWKQELQKREGSKFNIKQFHDELLLGGAMPLFMLRERVLGSKS